MTAHKSALTIGAAIAAITMVGTGLSLTIPLISLRMQAAGYSAGIIGLHTAVGAIASLVFAPFIPQLARRVGVLQIMLGALGLAIACLFGFGLIGSITVWLALRLLFGTSLTVLFIMSEFWITSAAPPARRGMIMGVYVTSLAVGFAVGPTLLLLTGIEGLWPFASCAALFALAAVPIAVAGTSVPGIEEAGKISLLSVLIGTPVATLAALTLGVVEAGSMSLLPIYAVRLDMGARIGAIYVALFAIGGVLFALPLGWLSDRIDRRKLMLGVALLGLAGALLAPALGSNVTGMAILLPVWGGLVVGLYPLALAHLGGRYAGAELANANAAIVMFYSTGVVVGPPILGRAMDAFGPFGLFGALAAVFALYATLVIARVYRSTVHKLS